MRTLILLIFLPLLIAMNSRDNNIDEVPESSEMEVWQWSWLFARTSKLLSCVKRLQLGRRRLERIVLGELSVEIAEQRTVGSTTYLISFYQSVHTFISFWTVSKLCMLINIWMKPDPMYEEGNKWRSFLLPINEFIYFFYSFSRTVSTFWMLNRI